jgi:hypothetical protein
MPVNNVTPNRGLQLPDGTNLLSYDVLRLIAAILAIDGDLASLITGLAGKANTSHTQAISTITGLQTALDGKADVGGSFALSSLTDVNMGTPVNGQIFRFVGTKWSPATPAAVAFTGSYNDLLAKPDIAGQIATAINNIVGAAPGTLNALDEIAAALGNDPNFATTMIAALAGKEPADVNIVKASATKALAAGYTVPIYDSGNSGTSTWVPNPALRNKQKRTVTGAFAISPPTADCDIEALLVMGAGAGAVSFSGWTYAFPGSDPITTTVGHKHKLFMSVSDGVSTYFSRKLQ